MYFFAYENGGELWRGLNKYINFYIQIENIKVQITKRLNLCIIKCSVARIYIYMFISDKKEFLVNIDLNNK